MGYTHYWYRKPNIAPEVFHEIIADFMELIGPAPMDHPLAGNILINTTRTILSGPSGDGEPQFTDSIVSFNGREGRGACESFVFERRDNPYYTRNGEQYPRLHEGGRIFNFCKTRRHPYDLAVTAFLIIAKHHMKDDLLVRSDGEEEDWFPAMNLCQRYLGYGADFTFDVEEDDDEDPEPAQLAREVSR